jgi:leucyl-tRNA synthetase
MPKTIYLDENLKWPLVDEKYLTQEKCEIVIQINGKKRNVFSTKKNKEKNEILEHINNHKLIDKYLAGGKILKTIYVQDKLINYIIK